VTRGFGPPTRVKVKVVCREQFRLIMSDSESTHGPRRSQRERKQVIHFTSSASLTRSFPCTLPPDVTILPTQVRLRRESATGLIAIMKKLNIQNDTSPLTQTMAHLRMNTNTRIIAPKSLGAKVLGHQRRGANRKHPNVRVSSRLVTRRRPPYASQKSLKPMATRQM